MPPRVTGQQPNTYRVRVSRTVAGGWRLYAPELGCGTEVTGARLLSDSARMWLANRLNIHPDQITVILLGHDQPDP